uniref:Uncharacterized protein n=1 Tax=Mucochytrium quahogii TaxID=96639 RepID=A0A7S2WE77_9STRA|mmetsp:Transcript_20416/g.44335  ORF Transcript_20416/g.44335 Transcript_20416/m.44335 type:complete len:156 (+) Transcript_20416:606-1073(+)
MHEKEIEKLRIAVQNLEQQAFTIEGASTTKDIISGMQAGKEAQAALQKQINIDDVEDLKDDLAEHMQMQDEINDILSTPLGGLEDDDDLLAELDELDAESENELDGLENEVAGMQFPSAPNAAPLPKAPAGALHVNNTDDEDAKALAALEAEMAM